MGDSVDLLTQRLRWIARALSVPIIGFTLFMLIGHILMPEPVEADYPPIENLLPVVMTLSVLCLGIAWRWEGVGGALSLVLFVFHFPLYWAIRQKVFPLRGLVIYLPIPLAGVLFLVCWWRSRGFRDEG